MGGVIPALAATGQISFTVYMDKVTGFLWTGLTMESFNPSHWSSYAIAAVEQAGSGRYISSIPATLPAGKYWVSPYLQVNPGGPAIGVDTPLDILSLNWDGTNIVDISSALNVGQINGSAVAAAYLALGVQLYVPGAAASGTLTTSQMTTNLTNTIANAYAGRILIFTSGANLGVAALITAYAVSGGKLTFIAYNNLTIPSVPSAADTFIIV